MNNLLPRFVVLKMLLLIGTLAVCQIPNKFSYQALIRSNNLPVVSKTVGLKISILKGSSSGDIIYSETHTTTSSPMGIISIEIGGGIKISGEMENISWSEGPYFIKIETDIEGGANYQLLGTTQLLSVPFALQAKTASNGYPKADSLKLLGISEGAEVNVNADWNAISGDAEILNKPIGNVVGDLLYWNGTKWNTLPKGNPGQILTINSSGLPTWQYLSMVPGIEQRMKYLRTSYDLTNYSEWIDIDQVYETITQNERAPILITSEICQFDFDGDGLEDIYCADPFTWASNDHGIVIYKNTGGTYLKTDFGIPTSNGFRALVGDYNGDSRPDVLSLSAIDLQEGGPGLYPSHLYFNNGNETMTQVEISGLGFWYAGASGDIDNDGDLDILIFNKHVEITNEKNRILWNDGHGNFTVDYTWIGDVSDGSVANQVDISELYDLNNDGFLDLIYNRALMPEGTGINVMDIMWGNGKYFENANKTNIPITNIFPILDINFVDADGDNISEIVFLYITIDDHWEIEIFKADKTFQTYTNVTDQFIQDNKKKEGDYKLRYLRIQDIGNNGKMDIFSTDKKSNIRWEQDVDGIFKRKY